MFPEIPTLGAFVCLEGAPVERPALVKAAIDAMFERIGIAERDALMALYKTEFREGRWRKYKASVVDEALADDEVLTIDLLAGSPSEWRFAAKLKLRHHPTLASDAPLQINFVCETQTWRPEAITDAGRRLLEVAAELARPLSGGVFRAPILQRALGEVDTHVSMSGTPDRYPVPADDWPRKRWEHVRRLYPITLLGPKFAAQVSAADATAAGALAVREIDGSLLIDASPTVVETWDPAYRKSTVALRRWLWPLTIQDAADAVGLGVKSRN